MTHEKQWQNPSNLLTLISVLIILMSLIAAMTGLFWQVNHELTAPNTFTTVQGETVTLYRQGLYFYDTVFAGAGSRGTDTVTLLLAIPLLIITTLRYRRGSMRGSLLHLGTLAYFLYVYASFALGTVTYNRLFILYIALFSITFYTFVLSFRILEHQFQTLQLPSNLPRLSSALFLFASGIVVLVIWLSPLIISLIQGQPPSTLGSYYTGRVTDALDLGIIAPATFIAGILILRRVPLGYLIALSLLVLEIMLMPMIIAQTIFQLRAGVSFTIGEIIGPITGFISLASFAVWITIRILRCIPDEIDSAAGET